MVKYLAKANNDVLSFCTCEKPLAAGPSQLDCPWCGCGWLICCMDCGKAFVFAEVVDVDRTYEDIVGADFRRRGYNLEEDEIKGAARWMAEAMEPFRLGDIVVYLDGCYFPVRERDIDFEGDFAEHRFDRLPHFLALERKEALVEALGGKSYWFERERPDRGDGL